MLLLLLLLIFDGASVGTFVVETSCGSVAVVAVVDVAVVVVVVVDVVDIVGVVIAVVNTNVVLSLGPVHSPPLAKTSPLAKEVTV